MEKLGLNLTSLIFQLINFLILFAILAKLVFPAVIKMLQNRKEKIEAGIKNADKVKQALATIEERKKEELHKAQQEALQIVKQSKMDAEKIHKDLVAQAEEEARQLIAKAQEDIKIKEKNALRNITNQAIELSVIAAENIMREKITSFNQDEIIQRSLKEFDKAYEQA